jgi:hypothetical protein
MTERELHLAIEQDTYAAHRVTNNGQCFEVRTPLMYPDGTIISVYVAYSCMIATDCGETVRNAKDCDTFRGSRGAFWDTVIAPICSQFGVSYRQGVLCADASPFSIGVVIPRVAVAELLVANALWQRKAELENQTISEPLAQE